MFISSPFQIPMNISTGPSVFVLAPGENWVCDRLTHEWYENCEDISTRDINSSNIIWLMGSWCWRRIPVEILKSRKVLTTVHHITPEKFSDQARQEFYERDKITDAYHVICTKTYHIVKELTDKPVYNMPYWINSNLWKSIEDKKSLREKYGISSEDFVVGSFQRDTEGSDLISPKLEKGPDIFCDVVEKMNENRENLLVLLAGWRRQYIINRLKKKGIKYKYIELPDFSTINELYNVLDLYIVSSRHEGGPQAIVECGITRTPIISTDVGIARQFLPDNSIYTDSSDFCNATADVDKVFIAVKVHADRKFSEFRLTFDEMYRK